MEARVWRTGARTARASSACATRPSSPSTRPAAPPAFRCRCSARSPRPPWTIPNCCAERVQTTVSSLLALAGIDAEPVQSREHILLSTILLAAWQAGESPDLGDARPARAAAADVAHRRHGHRLVLSAEGALRVRDVDQRRCWPSPGFEVWTQGAPLDIAAFLRERVRQAAGLDLLARASRRRPADVLRGAAAQRGHRVDARRSRARSSLRAAALHGRDLRLLPAGRQSAVEAAAADAAEAGARLRPRRRAGDAEPGRSGLQGTLEYRHLVARPPADRSRQGARPRRPRKRERGGGFDRARGRSAAVAAHEPRLPDAERARGRAHPLSVALGAVVPARSAGPRRHQAR